MALNLTDLSGKIALVCGAGPGGIGAVTAKLLADAGATIVAVDYSDDLLAETKALLAEGGAQCMTIKADLRDRGATAEIVPAIKREFGRLDLVANIAGGSKQGQYGPIEESSFETYDDVMALNLTYVIQVCNDAAKLMIENHTRGSIVNISSLSGLLSAPFHSHYGAAKAAVAHYTRTMAVEWGRYGLRVNAVAPGSVKTARAMKNSTRMDVRAQEWAPLARPVAPDDIARAVLFFLSELASGVTGQIMNVDCGVSSRCPIGGFEVWGTLFEPNVPPGLAPGYEAA